MLHVYVDESARDTYGLCVVAAVVLDASQEAAARAELAVILPPGAKRLHWNKDSPVVRNQVAQVLQRNAHHVAAYLSYYDANKRMNEARARCLTHLFGDVGGVPYETVTLDQRTPHQDTRDRTLWTQQCVRLQLRNPPQLQHDGTLTEPLLWLADAAAGAVGEHLVNNDPTYVQLFASKLVIA
ncbi:hypothetical protein [Clavibacter phaseoli]|uniref:hypothetical protein n=1 Tax=Clavibacter phaseoli TaxID=1734031 RepID=UPI001F3F3F3C|nr:hypothetical protein [Clavibacter phaseoli]UKF32432.1 DUF3800 domain-containing protein [Clavibacter phaseoli]UKF38451.1 DUF3800 domain-containing protein [Clavibacter phaseoli]